MASMLFVLFIVAPLLLLGLNLGRGAVGVARSQEGNWASRTRRPRPVSSPWPVRVRRPTPAVDPLRSLSPLAALHRGVAARRTARAETASARSVERVKTVRAQTVSVSSSAPLSVALPVTASPRGFVPAPANAFTADPALTPRRESSRALAA